VYLGGKCTWEAGGFLGVGEAGELPHVRLLPLGHLLGNNVSGTTQQQHLHNNNIQFELKQQHVWFT